MHKTGNPFIEELRDSLAKRTETTQNAEEFTVIAHLRGWCHHAPTCAICTAQTRAHKTERTLDSIISGG
jgi:hypothetical protein